MERYPGERLLLCPVDMPHLDRPTLEGLIGAAGADPDRERIYLAHDGQRLQPLLGLVPANAARRLRLETALEAGAYTCLFAAPASGLDLRPWLAPTTPPAELREAISRLWQGRADRWSEER